MMETRKTQFQFFTITDFEEEAQYLSKMHAKGWKFAYVSFPGFYHFVKCEPEEVIYQLDYNKEGRKNFAEYKQMYEDMGWEYLLDFVGYSYFRKPVSQMETDEKIFCDDDSRLDLLKRIFMGRVIPMLILLAVIILPFLVFTVMDPDTSVLGPAIMLVFYVVVFAKFGMKYRELKKKLGR